MSKITIGAGLFADGPVPVEAEDLDATLLLSPLTGTVFAELESKGVRFDAVKMKQAIINNKAILSRLLHGWENLKDVNGKDIPYTEENRDVMAGIGEFVAVVVNEARALGVVVEEDEEKN